ncbi:MAG: hypothetical protein U0575_10130 [Phycisphaerales bacterium]
MPQNEWAPPPVPAISARGACAGTSWTSSSKRRWGAVLGRSTSSVGASRNGKGKAAAAAIGASSTVNRRASDAEIALLGSATWRTGARRDAAATVKAAPSDTRQT